MKPRKIHKNSKFLLVKDYIRRNPLADNSTIIKDTYCSQSLVSRARTELRKEGLAGYAPGERNPYAREARHKFNENLMGHQNEDSDQLMLRGTSELMDLAAREGHLPDEAELDPKEFLKTLVRFIRDIDLPPNVRMSAIQLYTKTKADLLGRDSIGPGEPLTVDDQCTRLSMLMKAVGIKTAVRAMEAAFPKLKEAPDGEVNQTASPIGTTEVTEPTGHKTQEDPISDVRSLEMELPSDGPQPSEPNSDSGEHTP